MHILSKLENNIINGVLVGKGKNFIQDNIYNEFLKNDTQFKNFVEKGYIIIKIDEKSVKIKESEEVEKETTLKENKPVEVTKPKPTKNKNNKTKNK